MSQRLHETILHFGSNMGKRSGHLLKALDLVERDIGRIIQKSSVYETEAWGKTEQNDFLNQVIVVNTELLPDDLLRQVNAIENEMGRIRGEKWGSRLIDIDILFYDNMKIDHQYLKIPHPHIEKRNFVLVPLNEIKSDYIHPEIKKPVSELLRISKDKNAVKLFKPA